MPVAEEVVVEEVEEAVVAARQQIRRRAQQDYQPPRGLREKLRDSARPALAASAGAPWTG